MFSFKDVKPMTDVSVAASATTSVSAVPRPKAMSIAFTLGITLLIAALASSIDAAVTVYFSSAPANLQSQFIAQTTSQYTAKFQSNPYASSNQEMFISGPSPAYKELLNLAGIGDHLNEGTTTLANITEKMVEISTANYLFGFSEGMLHEREVDAGVLGGMMALCDNATNFNLVTIWPATCRDILGFASDYIVFQSSSTVGL